ncbi:MliC family protein [Kovacikia minuta CCNUW1]|uniref:MliC family protein n=1 Tax=Kovacikia minuta TaxID=2931930 RepID=UPI001CCC9891|nr:MliC family protein [Kovacikia minuta]UBF25491.1 MliC family protein [Kovacikia minuta CCNUW1]
MLPLGSLPFRTRALSQPEPDPSPTPQPAPSEPAPAKPASAQPKVINSVRYKCDAGKSFDAVYYSNQTVKATFGSKVITLPQVESGSGIRYSNGSVTLHGKGDTAFVEVGDRVLFDNCVVSGSVPALW